MIRLVIAFWEYTKPLRGRLALKPFGNNLLEPGAAFWVAMARLIVFLTATCEALSWGYLGRFLATGSLSDVAGSTTFLVIFLLVWAIDATLLTLDTSRPFYHKHLYGEAESVWPYYTISAGFAARLGIAALSLLITAPFLANMVFDADIRKEIATESAVAINSGRTKVEQSMAIEAAKREIELGNVANRLEEKQAAKTREVAGAGASKRYGEGPVARAIQQEIETLTLELARLEEKQANAGRELQEFDQAVAAKNFEKLRERWLVVLPENSIVKRGEVLARIINTPTYTDASLAIKAFLAFLFAALVMLKLFQPRSVRIYYSEALQAEWRRYDLGAMDKWMARDERSTRVPRSMTAFRFEDVMLNCYPAIREADFLRIMSSDAKLKILEADATLNEFESALRTQAGDEFHNVSRDLETLTNKRSEMESAIGSLEVRMQDLSRTAVEIEDLLREFETNSPGRYGFHMAKEKIKLDKELSSARRELDRTAKELEISQSQLRFVVKRQSRTEARRDELEARFAEFHAARSELKKRMLAMARLAAKGSARG